MSMGKTMFNCYEAMFNNEGDCPSPIRELSANREYMK